MGKYLKARKNAQDGPAAAGDDNGVHAAMAKKTKVGGSWNFSSW